MCWSFDIPGWEITDAVPVSKGMSSDEKFRVTIADGRCCLLRLSDGSQQMRKTAEFQKMSTAFEHGISVSEPYAMGTLPDGRFYQLTEWLSGRDLEEILPYASAEECCRLGHRAAQLLKQFHQIPAPDDTPPWIERFRQKIDTRYEEARTGSEHCTETTQLYRILKDRIGILENRLQCFCHGDYNPGNLILTDTTLAAVDFNAYNGAFCEPVFEASVILTDNRIRNEFRKGFAEAYPHDEKLLEYYVLYQRLAEICEG